MSQKKYIVRLSEPEREMLTQVVKKLKGTSQKVKRAQILLKADVETFNWTDNKIAEAFDCRVKTVENVRQRLVTQGLEVALKGKPRSKSAHLKKLDGEQEAQIIALRLGEPPVGYGQWSLRLLARKVVELEIVESISHETIRKVLKQTVLINKK